MSWGIGFGERRDEPVKRAPFLPTEKRQEAADEYRRKHTPRPHRKTFFLSIVLAFVLVGLLLAQCAGEFIRIDISGNLDDWTNIDYYQAPPLAVPVPFRITLWVPQDAPDQKPGDDRIGEYLGTRLDFSYGPEFVYRESYPASRVEVYSGFGTDLWGFRFSLPVEGEAYGLTRPPDGIFSFYVTTGQPIVMSDALAEVFVHQGDERFNPNKHADSTGITPTGMVVQANADETLQLYTATVVPELRPLGLLGFCVAAMAFFWRK